MNAERPIVGLVWNRVTTRRGVNDGGVEVVEIEFHRDEGDVRSSNSTIIVVPASEMNVWQPLNDARPSFAN